MRGVNKEPLGSLPISKLLIQQSIPASIGILVMSLNILIDTVFVGQWIGSEAIAAINVVLPVSFFIAALGMSIGVGGGSIISRSLGEKNILKAEQTFGNQITLTLILTVLLVIFGLLYANQIIPLFGGKGTLFTLAKTYYVIVMYGVPVLAFCMMANNTIRAEGKPKNAMYAMLLPSISNLTLDYIFIKIFDWGMMGAAWATTISYGVCALYILYFFVSKKSILRLKLNCFNLKLSLVREISSLGSVTLIRQAMVSVTVLLVNNMLFVIGGESAITVYAIISRMLMFASFPIFGITQGFLPIAGYNYGAKNWKRVHTTIKTSILYASILATFVLVAIIFFSEFNTSSFFEKYKGDPTSSNSITIRFYGVANCGNPTYWVSLFSSYWKSKTCSFTYIKPPSIFLYTTTFFSTFIFWYIGCLACFSISRLTCNYSYSLLS